MISVQFHNQVVYHLSQIANGVTTSLSQISRRSQSFSTNSEVSQGIAQFIKPCAARSESFLEAVNGTTTTEPWKQLLENTNVQSGNERVILATEFSLENVQNVDIRKRIQNLLLKVESPNRSKFPWCVSYYSTSSFEKNKRLGFNSMRINSQRILTTNVLPSIGNSSLLLQTLQNGELFTQQKRGFKTERMIEMEQARSRESFFKVLKPKSTSAEQVKPGEEGTQKVYGVSKKLQDLLWKMLTTVVVTCVTIGTFLVIMTKVSVFNDYSVHKYDPTLVKVTLKDVKGVDHAKKDLAALIQFLKNPQKFQAIGAKLPKGILLVGEPGTGKTLLAKAVAGEAGVPFFFASGSEFNEVFVGEGARRVRNLFKVAKLNAPCVIFIDEIESVGSKRTESTVHPYANQTINQLLTEMDGFSPSDGVIVLAATNQPSFMDDALRRHGRFDMEINVNPPTRKDRKDILKLYLEKVVAKDIDLELLSKQTAGLTGAAIQTIVNMAAISAAVENSQHVTMAHMMDSIDRVTMGQVWENHDHTSLQNVAYHEGGHTIVSYFTPHSYQVDKVTIQPRGASVGHTKYLKDDNTMVTKAQLMATIDSALGGRAAEEMIFGSGKITVGAGNDLDKATQIAKEMVKRFGMSDPNLRYVRDRDEQMGTESLNSIDAEIDKILKESMDRVKTLLIKHRADLVKVAEALLKYETLTADDLHALIGPQVGFGPVKK